MTTYSSDKAVPYVYICTHKETNQFYIGYREKNVKLDTPSHLDLPEYKTSSTTVNPEFSNYTWIILAEFFDPSHAYTFEQQLIFDNWENPLLLNGYYRLGEHKQFRNSNPHSAETRQKMSDARKGKTRSAETKQKMSDAGKGKTLSAETKQKMSDVGKNRPPISAETRQKLSDAKKGKTRKPHSAETRQKISDAKKGKPGNRKGKPHSAETKQKMSDAKKGKTHKLVTCPHCGLVGRGGNMTRYHFEHCKTLESR